MLVGAFKNFKRLKMNKVKKNRIRGKKIYETKAVPKLFIKKEVEVY